MYSAVLMLALTAGNESIDFGRNRCHGCNDYACSGSVYGCNGGSYGCHGGHGCHSYSSGCNCSSRGGLFHRNNNHCCQPACSSYAYGCSMSYGCAATYGCATHAPPVVAPPMKKDMPKGEKIEGPKKTSVNVPATIIVSLPADARLSVDGKLTTSTTERRTLITPVLEGDSTYVYTMQAEVTRDGRVQTQTQEVTVRGGEVSNVQFSFSAQSVASR